MHNLRRIVPGHYLNFWKRNVTLSCNPSMVSEEEKYKIDNLLSAISPSQLHVGPCYLLRIHSWTPFGYWKPWKLKSAVSGPFKASKVIQSWALFTTEGLSAEAVQSLDLSAMASESPPEGIGAHLQSPLEGSGGAESGLTRVQEVCVEPDPRI